MARKWIVFIASISDFPPPNNNIQPKEKRTQQPYLLGTQKILLTPHLSPLGRNA